MFNPFALTLDDIYRGLLVMFRIGGVFMTVPVFGHVAIPRVVRLWLVILVAYLVFPFAASVLTEPPATVANLTLVILSEAAVGFLMGYCIVLIFAAVQFAGHIIGLQMGLAVANVADPMSAGQISVFGEFYYLFSIIIYLLIGGHHALILALSRSFELVPVGGAVFSPGVQTFLVDVTFMVFVVGIKLAAPVIITLFIVNAVLGIIARTVPQMNVFVVGFPLAIAVGLVLVGVSFPFFYRVLTMAFSGAEDNLGTLIRLLQ